MIDIEQKNDIYRIFKKLFYGNGKEWNLSVSKKLVNLVKKYQQFQYISELIDAEIKKSYEIVKYYRWGQRQIWFFLDCKEKGIISKKEFIILKNYVMIPYEVMSNPILMEIFVKKNVC